MNSHWVIVYYFTVELEVHRGTVSAVRRQEQDDDNASVVSEDLREFDEEYRLKKTELPGE